MRWLTIVVLAAALISGGRSATATAAPRCAQDQITSVRTLDFGYAVRLNACRVLIVTPLVADAPAPVVGSATVEERMWVTSAVQYHHVVRYGRTLVTDLAGNQYQTTTRTIK